MVGTAVEQLVELRNYQLAPGAAPAFAEHFEAHFLASQEALGMDIVGQFLIVDDDDHFVWVRRYLEPARRSESLGRFYTSPTWKEFGPRANELMVDVNDVHLLVPHPSRPGFANGHVPHAERHDAAVVDDRSTVVATCYQLTATLSPWVVAEMAAALGEIPDVAELGRLVSAGIGNDFPALPIHEETVALWMLSDHDQGDAASAVAAAVGERCDLDARTLRLAPTRRSTLR